VVRRTGAVLKGKHWVKTFVVAAHSYPAETGVLKIKNWGLYTKAVIRERQKT